MQSNDPSEDRSTIRVLVRGKVQGVFFRSSLKSVADSGEVKGWARNLKDGSVEALLQGKSKDVWQVVEWCKNGPKMARVDKIETWKITENEEYRNFAVLT